MKLTLPKMIICCCCCCCCSLCVISFILCTSCYSHHVLLLYTLCFIVVHIVLMLFTLCCINVVHFVLILFTLCFSCCSYFQRHFILVPTLFDLFYQPLSLAYVNWYLPSLICFIWLRLSCSIAHFSGLTEKELMSVILAEINSASSSKYVFSLSRLRLSLRHLFLQIKVKSDTIGIKSYFITLFSCS